MERGTQETKPEEADGLGEDEPVRGLARTLCPPRAAAWNPEGSEEGSGELWCARTCHYSHPWGKHLVTLKAACSSLVTRNPLKLVSLPLYFQGHGEAAPVGHLINFRRR